MVAALLGVAVACDVAVARLPNALVGGAGVVVVLSVSAAVMHGDVVLSDTAVRIVWAELVSGAAALFGVWLVWQQAVGGGDVKVLAVLAAMLGSSSVVAAVLAGWVAMLVQVGASLAARRRSLPFGPALFAGFVAGVVVPVDAVVGWLAG